MSRDAVISNSAKTDAGENLRPHWNSMARQWTHIGPPLRPCKDDIAVIRSAVVDRAVQDLRVLMLGVTPEIAQLDWPSGTQLDAVERSNEMIDVVWPGDVRDFRKAHLGEWTDLPFEDSSHDLVIGDGCYTCMKFPDGYGRLSLAIHRALKPEGILIIRLFVSPKAKEQPRDVISDLLSGRIGSFHAFKWRLAMALQDDPETGVCLDDVWRTWSKFKIDRNELAERSGWSLESIQTIDLYRNKETRFSFPLREQLISEVQQWFDVRRIHVPTYELGERCPMLFLKPRST